MRRAVLLFTADLRLHGHPALRAAVAGADEVVPLFVLDPGVARAGVAAPVRQGFLAGCLADLDAGLRGRGGRLVDGDIAGNQLNRQWVAGTGTGIRPHRVLNSTLQGRRHDPDGGYVRRWVPEVAAVPPGPAVHEPWKLPENNRKGYPCPAVALSDGLARFRRARHPG